MVQITEIIKPGILQHFLLLKLSNMLQSCCDQIFLANFMFILWEFTTRLTARARAGENPFNYLPAAFIYTLLRI